MPAALAKRIIDELQSGPEGLHQVLARFVERARQAQCAVELLADKGLIGDAMAVFRTVVDIAIDVAYIVEPAADRDSRLSKFQAFECVTDWKFVAEFGDPSIVATTVVEAAAERAAEAKQEHDFKGSSNWDANTSDRSKVLTQLMGTSAYAAYRDGCRASHSGPVTLRYAFPDSAEGPPTTGDDAKELATLYLSALLRVVIDALSLAVPHDRPPFPWNE